MVYLERKRIAARDAAEAAGTSLWTTDLDRAVRGKLIVYARLAVYDGSETAVQAVRNAIAMIIEMQTGDLNPPGFEKAMLGASTDLALSYVDACYNALCILRDRPADYTSSDYYDPDGWARSINTIFNSHRVAYKFVDGEVVPLGSEELHREVVEPAIMLLHGRPELEAAQQAYRKALKEIANDDAADAITDAGTALQETLTALGCVGNALGPLIKDARRRGLIAPHDQTLADGLQKVFDWVSADRSETGDAHKASPAVLDDAWLAVHVVGALIVRLVGPPRTQAKS